MIIMIIIIIMIKIIINCLTISMHLKKRNCGDKIQASKIYAFQQCYRYYTTTLSIRALYTILR